MPRKGLPVRKRRSLADERPAAGRPSYTATDGRDGRVSIELSPQAAHDTARTIAEARAAWWLVDSRIDTAADALLSNIDDASALALIGRVGVANARRAYRRFTESMRSARWRALAEHGAHPQRLLWASTFYVDDGITGRFAEADDVLDTLASLGIDYHYVADRLERDGLRAFSDAWDRFLDHLRRSMYALR